MVILFLLGGMQGAIGWLMVKSGLVPEKYFVGHIELTTHLMAALLLLSYTLWFALKLKVTTQQQVINPIIKNSLLLIAVVLFFQLIYGGFMAGIKAAIVAPSWPDINGAFIPASITELSPTIKNIFYNPITIHFIHRGLAYLLFIMVAVWWWQSSSIQSNKLFSRLRLGLMLLIGLQVVLGILTVLNATYTNRLVWLGVSHQFTGMLLVVMVTALLFVVRKKSTV
jgi:cytochrome c oxidase assembly protein subunit 15